MKDKSIRPGTKVTCHIEQVGDNFIYLLYRHGGNTYRGVLLNEDCSAVRRAIPDGYFPKKAILDQATTDNLQNAITNHALDTQSKGLRSKKLKQSCIVLDDYELSSIGKSPIDSIRGLVERIDSNISLPKPTSAKTFLSNTSAANQSLQLKEVVIGPLKPAQRQALQSRNKTNDDLGQTRRHQIYHRRLKEIHFKAAPFDSRGIPAERKSSNYFNRRLAELNLNMTSKRKRPSGFSLLGSTARASLSPTKTTKSTRENMNIEDNSIKLSHHTVETIDVNSPENNTPLPRKQSKNKKSISDIVEKISSQKKEVIQRHSPRKRRNKSPTSPHRRKSDIKLQTRRKGKRKAPIDETINLDIPVAKAMFVESNENEIAINKESDSAPNTPTKRRYRKTKRITMQKRRKIAIPSLSQDLVEDVTNDIIPTERIKKTIDRQPKAKQKRVDPIQVALKNIKKYDSYRRRRNIANAVNMENYKLLAKPRKLRSGKKLANFAARNSLLGKNKRPISSRVKADSEDEQPSDIEDSTVSNKTTIPELKPDHILSKSNMLKTKVNTKLENVKEDLVDNINSTTVLINKFESDVDELATKSISDMEFQNTSENYDVDSCDIIFPRSSTESRDRYQSMSCASQINATTIISQSHPKAISTSFVTTTTAMTTSLHGATTSLLGPYILLPTPNLILQKTAADILNSRTLSFSSSNLSASSLSAIAKKVKGTKSTTVNRHALVNTKKRLTKSSSENRRLNSTKTFNKFKDTQMDYFTKKPEIMRNRPSIFGAKGMYTPVPQKSAYLSDSDKEEKTGDLDLVCHEKSLSPVDQNSKILPVPIVKKNRRKPLQVFKSLPNPAAQNTSTKTNEAISLECEEKIEEDDVEREQNASEKKEIVRKFRKKSYKVKNRKSQPLNAVLLLSQQNEKMVTRKQFSTYMTSHNTRFRGKKSVVPCLNLSPVRLKKLKVDKSSPSISKNLSVNLSEKLKLNENDTCQSEASSPVTSDKEDDESVKSISNSKIIKKKKVNKFLETFKKIKPLTRKNHDIRIGDVVWGRCAGHGWWPGVVLHIDTSSSNDITCQTKWFNSNTQSYMNFIDLKLYIPYFEKLFNTKKKSVSYTGAVVEALEASRLKYGSILDVSK